MKNRLLILIFITYNILSMDCIKEKKPTLTGEIYIADPIVHYSSDLYHKYLNTLGINSTLSDPLIEVNVLVHWNIDDKKLVNWRYGPPQILIDHEYKNIANKNEKEDIYTRLAIQKKVMSPTIPIKHFTHKKTGDVIEIIAHGYLAKLIYCSSQKLPNNILINSILQFQQQPVYKDPNNQPTNNSLFEQKIIKYKKQEFVHGPNGFKNIITLHHPNPTSPTNATTLILRRQLTGSFRK